MRIVKLIFIVAIVCGTSSIAQTRYYGGIDLGSKGTKATLFSLDKDFYHKTINTTLVSSMKDGEFTDAGIKDATDAVKMLINEMQSAAKSNKLRNVDYFVVGSSGVAKGKNKEVLAASVKAATGIDVDFIDAKKEGYFGLRSAVPKARLDASLYIDIGSGNTKLGCLVGGSEFVNFRGAEIPYGSVSGRNKAAEMNTNDTKAAIQQVMQEKVGPAYEKESMDVPCLRNRERIYWTGGAAWATATFTHPEKARSDHVIITRHDIEIFLSRLGDGSWNQKHFQYSFPKAMSLKDQAQIRAAAEKDRKSVMDVFVREDLLSGISIMKTVLDISNPSATVTFVRGGGDFLFGYAMEKYHDGPHSVSDAAFGRKLLDGSSKQGWKVAAEGGNRDNLRQPMRARNASRVVGDESESRPRDYWSDGPG